MSSHDSAQAPDAPAAWRTRAERRAALEAAREQGENLVVVLGHAEYYPRFGCTPASGVGVTAPFDVPDEAFLALALAAERPTPRGQIAYPPAFGV
ncbi:hypothetical protein [Brachybacterium paraconglomeratum]|uniref:hypothetical protein n=1 Tax=Brachybacterium paraconglomeratum TaxID=173362 RepID=UPI0021A49FD1|nr:hypothetical protein [Brachybacterium paraconglomeratum]MCT1908210.1 hypothetical protein [Brachybacterium paraconglomeratum]